MNKHIGEESISKRGQKMKIIGYREYKDIDVQFSDGTIVKNCCMDNFRKGLIKNPNFPSVYGQGYMSQGNYNKFDRAYSYWANMLKRCYCEASLKQRPTYIGCEVSSEWKNYQKFAEWFDEHYVEGWALDKDILNKGNKIYSKENCCFVPSELNSIILKKTRVRPGCLLGVHYDKKASKFVANMNTNGLSTYLGESEDKYIAFQLYKKAKEKYISDTVEKYKGIIDERAYIALKNYVIEMED